MSSKLCWFCGNSRPVSSLVAGRALGQLILESDSLDSTNRRNALSNDEWQHIRLDEALICTTCLRHASDSIGELEDTYLTRMKYSEDEQFCDMFDYETGLIELSQRESNQSCFFCHATALEDSKLYYGKTFGELFECGFRFQGKIQLDDLACEAFCQRMTISRHDYPGFVMHAREHLVGVSDPALAEIGKTRIQILDYAVNTLLSKPSNNRRPTGSQN